MILKMKVTINTDASWHPKEKGASYAFWISSPVGRFKKSGPLKDKCERAEYAEFKCILNSLHYLFTRVCKSPEGIIINTDCLNIIHVINLDTKRIKQYGLGKSSLEFMDLRRKFWAIIPKTCKVELRHVKSHESTNTARQYVNDWCDKEARRELHKLIYL